MLHYTPRTKRRVIGKPARLRLALAWGLGGATGVWGRDGAYSLKLMVSYGTMGAHRAESSISICDPPTSQDMRALRAEGNRSLEILARNFSFRSVFSCSAREVGWGFEDVSGSERRRRPKWGQGMTQCERMTVLYYHLQVNRNISVARYNTDILMIVTGSDDEDDKPGKILRTTVGRSVGAAE
jgi:hypothetical protein